MNNTLSLAAVALAAISFTAATAAGDTQVATAEPTPTTDAPASSTTATATQDGYRMGIHADIDLGTTFVLKQGGGFGAGVTYGPFRVGLSYATFKSDKKFGGTPDGFEMRANYIYGLNAAYFIGQDTDRGFYIQGMLHVKQQGVTNTDNGAHEDLNSIAVGAELGYVWKVYKGLYVAPRVGALYYVEKPQPGNDPVDVGGAMYDNKRHKNWDTYFIPTVSVGYSW